MKTLTFLEFLRLGHESSKRYTNPFISSFVKCVGPLGINAKIRSGHILNTIQRHIQAGQRQIQVLDAGCGLGYASFWIAQEHPVWTVKGVDSDKGLVEQNIKIAKSMNLSNLFFEHDFIENIADRAKYDIIYSADVLEHIDDDSKALNALHRALKKNGLLILHLPLNRQKCRRILPFFKPIIMTDHVREEYTLEEISRKLTLTGFNIIETGFGYSWKGELAYEFNYLFWEYKWIRMIIATLLHFPTNVLAYLDVKRLHPQGNSIVVVAKPLGL